MESSGSFRISDKMKTRGLVGNEGNLVRSGSEQ